jgi:hypothetical protein
MCAYVMLVCQHERVNLGDLGIDKRKILKSTLKIEDVNETIKGNCH